MAGHVEQILDRRQHRTSAAEQGRFALVSVVGHVILVVAFLVLPGLFHEPPEPLEFVALTVVPPKALGVPDPPPETPTREVKPEPAPPPPPPPKKTEPEPEPPPPDRPVIAEKPKPAPPPPPKPPPPAPTPKAEPPKRTSPVAANPMARRQGSLFGNPVGSSTAEATIGVEDPNFTYGYYLDRIVAVISENWTRPPVGVVDAVLHFRILPDGTVVDLQVRRTSGDEGFDQAALRAVRASSPLPPLPKGYKKDFLGINLIVK